MKKIFYFGTLGFILFEIAHVYFIMPMPGSQEMNSIDAAYFLHTYRWAFRGFFGLMMILGLKSAFFASKWMPSVTLAAVWGVLYATNLKMAADTMFYQPEQLILKDSSDNKVENGRIVLGVTHNGHAKAYPIQYLGYHHQVRDSIGGKPIMVTYCTVCRTGRVFEPLVKGRVEAFRLVGMDHFNAMFEDQTTGSWWRQATGEAVAGPLKGQVLPEMVTVQTSLAQWFALHPNSLVMQPDQAFQVEYDSMKTYEAGRIKGNLTKYDTASWQKKSWVAGITLNGKSKAFDWNVLKRERIIHDVIDNQPIVIVLTHDGKGLYAFRRASNSQYFRFQKDSLSDGILRYDLSGKPVDTSAPYLAKINVYQEYWHSWKTFHPNQE